MGSGHYIVKTKAGEIIAAGAQDEAVVILEGNWYFAADGVDMRYLRVTERTYKCPYKGVCYWIDLDAPGIAAQNVGWVYRNPKRGFEAIKDRIGLYSRNTAGTLAEKT